jgi:hypothetical protein
MAGHRSVAPAELAAPDVHSEPQTLVCVTSATTPPAGGAGTSDSWKSIFWAAGTKAMRPFMADASASFEVTDEAYLRRF